MRDLKTLYELLWERVKDKNYIESLCIQIDYLYILDKHISEQELYHLRKHFLSQKELYTDFMTEERNWRGGGDYWWNSNEDLNPVNRKAFVQKIISSL